MRNNDINDLVAMFKNFSEKEQSELVDRIVSMMNDVKKNGIEAGCGSIVKEHTFKSNRPDCPRCKAKSNMGYILKRGFDKGAQRYYCKCCGKYFVATTNTVFENTQKSSGVWKKFIHMTIKGESIRSCAAECKICIQTAFTWRHKVLNAFKVHQDSLSMNGEIEADETLFRVSFKGNHIKGSFKNRKRLPGMSNNLPRESFKRGSDNRSKSPYDKACVFCMVKNGNEMYCAEVPGVGFMKPNMLDATLAKHVIKDESIVIADQYKVTWNYLQENGYEHVILAGNTMKNSRYHKPEIKGEYHLQHVNAMHHHIRDFIKNYSGVSTKYLPNYVALYTWLKNISANKQKKKAKEVSLYRVSSPDCYITRKSIEAMPAIPMCA